MNTNILLTASALSDQDLLARLEGLARSEREASAELVAHLAALDGRPALYAAQGYGSLFSYCTQALRLSEDAACNRIEAARACRRFPLILDRLASGSLSLTSIRLLSRHLTAENHEAVLEKARHRTRREIDVLVAELAPRPDLPSTVRKLPCFTNPRATLSGLGPAPSSGLAPTQSSGPGPTQSSGHGVAQQSAHGLAMTTVPSAAATAPPPPDARRATPSLAIAPMPSPSAQPTAPRPIVRASAPERYRMQFTIGEATHEKLR